MKRLKLSFKGYFIFALLTAVITLFALPGCGAQTENVQGLLQAVDGQSVLIKLDDGTLRQLAVAEQQSAKAQGLVGEMVKIEARSDRAELVKVERLGENQHFTGVIESIGAGTWSIGGRTVTVTGNTRLDGGLIEGVLARVELVQTADGKLVAKEIETDNTDEHFVGTIQSMTATTVTIDGKTFQVQPGTRLDNGLAVGMVARVEGVARPDGTIVASKIETNAEDEHLAGVIQSLSASSLVINGQEVKLNAATAFDRGVALGAAARVEFIKLSDGSLLASKVEVDRVRMEQELRGREQELRGREQELGRREQELRGREQEIRGREAEIRGREEELRGREAEGEAPRGQDGGGLRGDGSVDDNLPRHSGLDDGGLRGDGTVDDNLPRHSGLDDGGARGDGSVDDNSGGSGGGSSGSGSSGSGSDK